MYHAIHQVCALTHTITLWCLLTADSSAIGAFQSTECEIFLSLLVKFMDVEKPMWQRCVALEVVHRLCSEPKLVRYGLPACPTTTPYLCQSFLMEG